MHRLKVRLNSKVPLYGGSWGQNTSQNSKQVPAESKNTFQRPKHFPESKNTSQNPKTLSRIQKCFRFWELFWILVRVLSLWATVPLPLHYTLFGFIPATFHACGLKTPISRIKDNSADNFSLWLANYSCILGYHPTLYTVEPPLSGNNQSLEIIFEKNGNLNLYWAATSNKACIQTLFYFSSRSFQKRRQTRSARKKNKDRPSIFFFPHPYPPCARGQ